jgi:hypothetical protein
MAYLLRRFMVAEWSKALARGDGFSTSDFPSYPFCYPGTRFFYYLGTLILVLYIKYVNNDIVYNLSHPQIGRKLHCFRTTKLKLKLLCITSSDYQLQVRRY